MIVTVTLEMTETGSPIERDPLLTTDPEKGEMIETGDHETESGKIIEFFIVLFKK